LQVGRASDSFVAQIQALDSPVCPANSLDGLIVAKHLLQTLCGVSSVFLIAGCVASKQIDRFGTARAEGSKTVALDAPSEPWVAEIERRLRGRGFRVMRWATRTQVSVSRENSTETFNAAEARYILKVQGAASLSYVRRCFGGGYFFDYLNVELIDTRTNEALLNASDAGHSEGCPPVVSHTFGGITDAVAKFWD
jgi:hypothetical protein